MQVVDPKEIFPGTRVVDTPLTEDQGRNSIHLKNIRKIFTKIS